MNDIHEFHNKQETKRVFSSEFTFETKFKSKLFLITKRDRITAFLFSEKTKQENEFKLQKMTKESNVMRAIIINHALLFDFENQIIMTLVTGGIEPELRK